jgi:hypothetical protein
MNFLNKEKVIDDYLYMPTIRHVLSNIENFEKIHFRYYDLSLKYCLRNDFIHEDNKAYQLTITGKKALKIIEQYKKEMTF